MAAARNTTSETDIRRKLDEYVDAHLTRHMYDTDESWPLRKTIRLPKQAELEQHYNQIRAQNETIRDWARQHHCETSEKTKIVSSGLIQQKKPTHRLRDHTRPRHRPPHRHQTNPRTLPTRTRPHERARQRIRPRTGERHERRQNPQRPRRHRLPPRHPSRPLLRKPRLPHHDPTHGAHPRIQRQMARRTQLPTPQSDTPAHRTRQPHLPGTPERTPTTPHGRRTPRPTRPHRHPTMGPQPANRHRTRHHHRKQRHLPGHAHRRTRHLHPRQRIRRNITHHNTPAMAHHHPPTSSTGATWTPTDSTSSPNYAPPASHAHPY